MSIQMTIPSIAYSLAVKHNYIQWLFPLSKASGAVPGSPIMGKREAEMFRTDPELKRKLMIAFIRMLKFYGFVLGLDIEKHPTIEKAEDFDERKVDWLTPQNHNYKRISRILESLTRISHT